MAGSTPPLLLTPADLSGLVTASEAIDAVEAAHRDWAETPGHGALCRRTRTAEDTRVCVHQGTAPQVSSTGLFVHAEAITSNNELEELRGRGTSITVVYRTEDASLAGILLGEPTLAELPESIAIAGVRTAATTAVGTRALARQKTEMLGMIGTGKQAEVHLAVMRAAMDFERAAVFSRDHSRARAFADATGERLGVEVIAMDSARAVVESSDVIITATNSRFPVVDGAWLAAGQHVTSIVGGVARTGRPDRPGRRELDDETDRRADMIAYASLGQARLGFDDLDWDDLPGVLGGGDPARPFGGRVADLGDLLRSAADGRRSDDELTVFKNNAGQGVADVAIAGLALAKAQDLGLGIEIRP